MIMETLLLMTSSSFSIIGGYNKEGVEEPLKITFVYKTGIHSNFNGKDFKPKRRNAAALHSDAELCSYASDEAAELCSHSSNDTCGDGLFIVQTKIRSLNQGVCFKRRVLQGIKKE